MRRRRLERLNRREEKSAVKKTVYLSIFSVGLLIFIFTLGIPLLGKFADFLDVVFKNKTQDQTTSDKSAVQAPILDDLPQATNSAKLVISGFLPADGKILIFDNDEKVGETKSQAGQFKLEDFSLKPGTNNIAAKAVLGTGKESDFSIAKKVAFLEKEPTLEVTQPADGQTFSGNNRIRVSGKTDKDVQVYANGFLGNTSADGSFEVFVPLSPGGNNIEIKAVDLAGNSKVVTRKVNFNR